MSSLARTQTVGKWGQDTSSLTRALRHSTLPKPLFSAPLPAPLLNNNNNDNTNLVRVVLSVSHDRPERAPLGKIGRLLITRENRLIVTAELNLSDLVVGSADVAALLGVAGDAESERTVDVSGDGLEDSELAEGTLARLGYRGDVVTVDSRTASSEIVSFAQREDNVIVAGTSGGDVYFLGVAAEPPDPSANMVVPSAHTRAAWAVAVIGTESFTASSDGSICRFDSTCKLVEKVTSHPRSAAWSLLASASRRCLFAGRFDGSIECRPAACLGQVLWATAAHTRVARCLSLCQNDHFLAAGCSDGRVTVLDAVSGQVEAVFQSQGPVHTAIITGGAGAVVTLTAEKIEVWPFKRSGLQAVRSWVHGSLNEAEPRSKDICATLSSRIARILTRSGAKF
jgi:WD40 repeat protein